MRYLWGIIIGLICLMFISTPVLAVDLSVRLDEPNSPTNENSFDIGLVALDIPGRTVTAQCYKKGPSDAGFSTLGSAINLGSGGGTSFCSVTSSTINQQGTYQFYAEASAGLDTEISQVVAVDYNTSGPGTPVSYEKSKTSSCQYTIKFKTADDSGKTSYVEVYRSSGTTIGLNAGSRVGTVNAGSNEEKTFVNGIPDCGKTYYYVIRAFDTAGNASGTIGDTIVTTVSSSSTTSTSTTTTTQEGVASDEPGALFVPEEDSFVTEDSDVEASDEQQGEESDETEEGQESEDAQSGERDSEDQILGAEDVDRPINWILVGSVILFLLLAIFGYFYYSKKKTA